MATSSERKSVGYELIGSYTRYSSWTARVVTLLEYYQISYNAKIYTLAEIKAKKPTQSGLVPALISPSLPPDTEINDSLAICEYLAESHPQLPLWPKDVYLRALACSATAEMHAGFTAIRDMYHSNFIGKYTGDIPMSDAVRREVERILRLWGEVRGKTRESLKVLGQRDEGFFFGEFGIVDSFYWPVLWRFRTYNCPLDTATPEALAWMQKMWNDEKLKLQIADYFKQFENPETQIEGYEDIFKGNPDVEYGRFTRDWVFEVPS
ncbi:hypothetical protein AJ80_04320 [Polytolypa hystricis UAMH7299]|uniref:GST N-terminal domain-containing protein n=1 Tax=Polytolypa hystricis (strain UAMH7299) TaxID=1447883 RepID=A0A2B7YDF4_POLH7|nr:hypothetical protein AJ80_04320 [Polytolypa hystricis UAMH7299]